MHGQITRAPATDEEDRIDLHQVLDFLRRRRVLIGLVAVTTVVLALASAFLLTPRYTSTAEILLDQASRTALGAELGGSDAASVATNATIEKPDFHHRIAQPAAPRGGEGGPRQRSGIRQYTGWPFLADGILESVRVHSDRGR
ncbi:Wzz/FepE/Etk N-terminal domain-containing protein [Ancylobacter dichloromethanicus]